MQINKGKAQYWLKLISITGSAQIIVQAVGFLSGILVIRLLPVQEYALYTLANTMLGMMTLLSNGGISTGVLALGGKVWQDKTKLGAVLATGLDLRRKFAVCSLLVSLPILAYLLLHHGANILTTTLISISLIPAFFTSLSDNLLQIPVKLHQAITPLQKNQVAVGLGRLALTGVTLFAFPWAFVAIIGYGIPRIWGNLRLREIANGFVDKDAAVNREDREEILKMVKKILPTSIYFALSGQLSIWLISIFGNTSSVAQLGALGRLSMVLTLLSSLISTLMLPRFAKTPKIKGILIKRFFTIVMITVLSCMLMIVCSSLFSSYILMIFGSDYLYLSRELLLYVISSCIALLSGIISALNNSRGWILNPVVLISISVIAIIVGISIFDISTLRGVLYYNIFMNIIGLVRIFSYTLLRMKKI
jgi:O-antigen/teichoic acid export membrane protein